MAKIPKKCPSCQHDLSITRLTCQNCGTEVTGSYTPDFLWRLSPNDFDFIVLFIKTRGNIKEMERALGISYWSIRSKLNEIVEQLGLEDEGQQLEETTNQRQVILEQLNSGLISVQEAAAMLEKLKK
jgi:hypothetical protein